MPPILVRSGRIGRQLLLSPPRHEGEALEKVRVLLVLDQRACQRRHKLARIALAQQRRIDVLVQKQFQPVEQFRR